MCSVKSTGLPKVIYESELTAWITIRRGQHYGMKPYECPDGLGWHIGHPSAIQSKPIPQLKKSKPKKKTKWEKFVGK